MSPGRDVFDSDGKGRTVGDGALLVGDILDLAEDEGGVVGLGHGAGWVQIGRPLRSAGLLKGSRSLILMSRWGLLYVVIGLSVVFAGQHLPLPATLTQIQGSVIMQRNVTNGCDPSKRTFDFGHSGGRGIPPRCN